MPADLAKRLLARGPLGWATRVALGLCLGSLGLVQIVSRAGQAGHGPNPAREARIAQVVGDPETTGSIGAPALAGAVKSIALDPCSVVGATRERLVVRGP